MSFDSLPLTMFSGAYQGTRVLLTGDTGFKGAWMALWLKKLGANVFGLALPPADRNTLFCQAGLHGIINHADGDVRDLATVEAAYGLAQPDIVFHLAAQALVRESYRDPLGTMMTNAIGTAHVCDALRRLGKSCALVVITSDKCYQNHEWEFAYRENDAIGGSDPYSASKGSAELITASWRESFFPLSKLPAHHKPVASARAGNVIGPGDWATDRIIPDAVRALLSGEPVVVRNPNAIRPWQHVLEPLSGYLALGAKLLSKDAAAFVGGWNFGPDPGSMRTVRELAERFITAWGSGSWENANEVDPPPESHTLRLAIDKAVTALHWNPAWDFGRTLDRTAEGYRRLGIVSNKPLEVRKVLDTDIEAYVNDARAVHVRWAEF